MVADRNGLEILGREESLGLLRCATVGRVGFTTADGIPLVLPVNFRFDGDRVLILTTEGTKLEAATAHAVFAFEVDDFDPVYHSGWSVLVTGEASTVTDEDELAALDCAPLTRWASAGNPVVVQIAADEVSGRRLCGG